MKIERNETVNITINLTKEEWLDLSNALGTVIESSGFYDMFLDVHDDSHEAARESWQTFVKFWESL